MSEALTVPGVYVTESSGLSLSIQSGETAVPLFVGIFRPLIKPAADATPACERIESWPDFISRYGSADNYTLNWNQSNSEYEVEHATDYHGYWSLRLYFENGGGPCYIYNIEENLASPGHTRDTNIANIGQALAACPDITLLCWCEYLNGKKEEKNVISTLGGLLSQGPDNPGIFMLTDALAQGDKGTPTAWAFENPAAQIAATSQVAVYFPALQTSYNRGDTDGNLTAKTFKAEDQTLLSTMLGISVSNFEANIPQKPVQENDAAPHAMETEERVDDPAAGDVKAIEAFESLDQHQNTPDVTQSQQTYKSFDLSVVEAKITQLKLDSKANKTDIDNLTAFCTAVRKAIKDYSLKQPSWSSVCLRASVAMAGVYARTDRERGVWKAPANVALSGVTGLVAFGQNSAGKAWDNGGSIPVSVGDDLNSSLAKNKINAIRAISGQGFKVWGARTMVDTSDVQWRYVPIRRLFNAFERDARDALRVAVFEPNTPATWEQVRSALDNYLHALWRKGALQGDSQEQAYFVHAGLGTTMTREDISNGKLIVRIGLAAVRPAEFIILEFAQDVKAS